MQDNLDELPVGLLLIPNSRRGWRTLDAVMNASVEVFGAAPARRKASVAAVAQKVGISPAAIYQYFPDREALVLAAIEKDLADLFDRAIESVETEDSPFITGVFGDRFSQFRTDFPLATKSVINDHLDMMTLPRVAKRVDRCIDVVTAEIEAAKAAGLVRPDADARAIAQSMMITAVYTTLPDRLAGNEVTTRSNAAIALAMWALAPVEPETDIFEFRRKFGVSQPV